ncbi:12063_t:CDS:2 [Ambispora gerdemannii]|uniref:12063_t:CDS:1 n=1 Tax=Ambispora gerdemannii TaxID=144530 RepID=A0A9N9CSG6_9GLOM|nr:12063_t:CDS:2 [Ambispora gerdemannii]
MPPVKAPKANTPHIKTKNQLKALCREYELPAWGTRADLEDRIRDREKTPAKNRIFDYVVKKSKPKASLPSPILTSLSSKPLSSSSTSTTPLSSPSPSKTLCSLQAKNLEYDLESVEKSVADTLCMMKAAK